MKTVTQMVSVIKEVSGLSKDKEIEKLMGIKPMGMASLKRENRVGSFLKFLVPYCERNGLSINDFLVTSVNSNIISNVSSEKEEDMMYREKFELAQQKIINLLEENSELKRLLTNSGFEKKVGKTRKAH